MWLSGVEASVPRGIGRSYMKLATDYGCEAKYVWHLWIRDTTRIIRGPDLDSLGKMALGTTDIPHDSVSRRSVSTTFYVCRSSLI